jgi:beta-mannosidase
MDVSPDGAVARLSLSALDWELSLPSPDGVPEAVAAAFAGGATIPATVPGCVHDDLLAAGLIPDPFAGDNAPACLWIGRQLWRYEARLPAVSAERVDLAADGLDTIAELSLDGRVFGRTANQHRRYRFDLTGKTDGGGRLRVDFASVYQYAAEREAEVGALPTAFDLPFPYVRKMFSNFGWDWAPNVATAGIWKDIRLETWGVARLAHVRPLVSLPHPASRLGLVEVPVAIERTGPGSAETVVCTVEVGGRRVSRPLAPGTDSATLNVAVPYVDLWWPNGLGGQPLYPLSVTLARHDGR